MAESDLAEIWFYVAGEASGAAATRLIDKIRDAKSIDASCSPAEALGVTAGEESKPSSRISSRTRPR